MVTYPTPQSVVYKKFKGLRTRNGVSSGGQISAVVCQNIDFVPSEFEAGVIIRTAYGNVPIAEMADDYKGYKVIKGFEFDSESDKHMLLYCENDTKGVLLELKDGVITPIIDNTEIKVKENKTVVCNFSVTGEANAIALLSLAYDTFVITNGKEYYAYCPDGNTKLQKIEPKYDGKSLTGLAMCEQEGSIVIGTNEGVVIGSRKGDVTDFDYTISNDNNKAWYQLFGKPITAVVPYIQSLIVFTADDSTVLTGNMSEPSTAKRENASLGGCMSFESWVKHDKYLFFYDDTQKNIYYYTQNDFGQKILSEPIAPEIQEFFDGVTKMQMISYIGENRSEIWLLSDKHKLIYDYFIGEWTERTGQTLTSYFTYDNAVYSTGGGKVLKEKAGEMGVFDGVFYPAVYTMQTINLGSFSNMKEMEFQPLISVFENYDNNFYIDCLINGKKTKTKYVQMYLQGAIWADDEPQTNLTSENELWDVQTFGGSNPTIVHQVKGKFISNWYYLQFTFRTAEQGDNFSIVAFELKGITQETDTVGVK